ncbi:hypothetical protein D3C80_1536680 [compost metagenome]
MTNSGNPNNIAMARLLRCAVNVAGPTTQPIRQPLMAWDFDTLSMITQRSAMPGRLAGSATSPSYSSPLYT